MFLISCLSLSSFIHRIRIYPLLIFTPTYLFNFRNPKTIINRSGRHPTRHQSTPSQINPFPIFPILFLSIIFPSYILHSLFHNIIFLLHASLLSYFFSLIGFTLYKFLDCLNKIAHKLIFGIF